jgi:hypothetical protein
VTGSHIQPILSLQVMPRCKKVKAPIQGVLLYLPTNIELGLKDPLRTNTLAYFPMAKVLAQ